MYILNCLLIYFQILTVKFSIISSEKFCVVRIMHTAQGCGSLDFCKLAEA